VSGDTVRSFRIIRKPHLSGKPHVRKPHLAPPARLRHALSSSGTLVASRDSRHSYSRHSNCRHSNRHSNNGGVT
jgi:hypothetical protein